jgi:hypothetical protein
MDWFELWMICGVLALVGGLWWDVYRGHFHYHIIPTVVGFVVVCLVLGPIALVIVLDLWLKHRE